MARHKFPWTKLEQTEKEYSPLQWKRNPFASMRWEREHIYHFYEVWRMLLLLQFQFLHSRHCVILLWQVFVWTL